MTTIVIAPTGAMSFPDGGGHWWVYLQYALGLRDLGCRVVWLERCDLTDDLAAGHEILRRFGFAPDDRLLYSEADDDVVWHDVDGRAATRALESADALLDFDYSTPASLVAVAQRSALIDIDPGLMQTWWAAGLINPAEHDHWISTGETVGTPRARFSDCGVDWVRIRPCVHLPSWPFVDEPDSGWYTTITSWWGDEWLTDTDGTVRENNKRVGFVPYFDLPRRTSARLELSAYFGPPSDPDDQDITPDNVDGDGADVAALLAGGWRLRRTNEVASSPEQYRSYVQGSRGELSCVKPSCRWFENAWISDRSLCYLAAGRPVVVEHTGPSDVLDRGEGLLRFTSPAEAVDALARVEADYQRHRRAARDLVEADFSSKSVLTDVLDTVLR